MVGPVAFSPAAVAADRLAFVTALEALRMRRVPEGALAPMVLCLSFCAKRAV